MTVALAAGAAVGGYALGRSQAATEGEAARERLEAQRTAERSAYRRAFAASQARGRREGSAQGRRAGVAAAQEQLANHQAAAQQRPAAEQSACPPGQQLLTKMGVRYCGRPGPARPEDCPRGQEPVGVTGACAPKERASGE